jgi:hypothetical protein
VVITHKSGGRPTPLTEINLVVAPSQISQERSNAYLISQ